MPTKPTNLCALLPALITRIGRDDSDAAFPLGPAAAAASRCRDHGAAGERAIAARHGARCGGGRRRQAAAARGRVGLHSSGIRFASVPDLHDPSTTPVPIPVPIPMPITPIPGAAAVLRRQASSELRACEKRVPSASRGHGGGDVKAGVGGTEAELPLLLLGCVAGSLGSLAFSSGELISGRAESRLSTLEGRGWAKPGDGENGGDYQPTTNSGMWWDGDNQD